MNRYFLKKFSQKHSIPLTGLIKRQVINSNHKTLSLMYGRASLKPNIDGSIEYSEIVYNIIGTTRCLAKQSYLIYPRKNSLDILIKLPSPKLIVSLPQYPIHKCGNDNYLFSYTWKHNLLAYQFDILGPKKNYLIKTLVKFKSR